MSHADRVVRERRLAAERQQRERKQSEERAQADKRAALEAEIRGLIPDVLRTLELECLREATEVRYEVLRFPFLGTLLGYRAVAKAAWVIAEWEPPWLAGLHGRHSQPIWLVSNGYIGTLGRGSNIVEPVEQFANSWAFVLPAIRDGLQARLAPFAE
jgi:hypothetical protein